jgi:hypothetical protein
LMTGEAAAVAARAALTRNWVRMFGGKETRREERYER